MIDDYHRKLQDDEEDELDVAYDYENEEELEHEYQRQLFLLEQKKKKQDIRHTNLNRGAFEVDYEYFARHFFPTARKYHIASVTVHLCWT